MQGGQETWGKRQCSVFETSELVVFEMSELGAVE